MPVNPAAHYRMFGHNNAWANGRLYEAVARLSVEQYRVDRGAFFKSVQGTLNHLLVTDRIWMQRFTGMGDAPGRLAASLRRSNSSSNWPRRWRIDSIIKPTTEGKSMPC